MSNVYLKYFGLNESPFAITPDPAFVYLSPAHRDALAHLLHGVGEGGSGGFVQLTGEVGTGKTTMCRCLLEQLPEKTQVALILNPLVTPQEMLATICEELGISTDGIADSSKRLVDALNVYLLEKHAQGWRVVVVIDEAQRLSPEALEQVRLLTNLETAKDKLLQMVLLGQPELRKLLQRQDLRQLAQRVTARYHLASLDASETAAYVRHRMDVAGASRSPFTRSALKALYQRSGGVPRLINIIADRALAGAYASEAPVIGARLVHAAADEVQPGEREVHGSRLPWMIAAASALALLVVTIVMTGWLPGGITAHGTPQAVNTAVDVASADSKPEEAPGPAEPAFDPSSEGVGKLDNPVQAPSAEAAPETQFDAALDEDWLGQQNAMAWHGLAELWNRESQSDAIRLSCAGAQGTGFACLHGEGNWSRIQRLGLPALLVLQSDQPRYLLLRGVGESQALVGVGEAARWIPRSLIEDYWLGRYVLPWPQAPEWPSHIRRGERGEAVDIVMELAAQADFPWIGGGEFDEGFESWLKGFQRRHGLVADGIVGPETLLHLMAPTITSPRLATRHELTAQDS